MKLFPTLTRADRITPPEKADHWVGIMLVLTVAEQYGVSLHSREDRAGFAGLVIGRKIDRQRENQDDQDL
ncbi:MAG: hypothetical protein DRI46_06035 [Chloroflexi bacterium]|nr:MAG: hypothetical protein DRI46_06035 [Chloroflexota bacterium]